MYEIYTKPSCSYCVAAKKLLESKGEQYIEIQVGKDIDVDQVKQKFPGVRSVPVIVYNGEFVGGYVNLVERFEGDGKQLLTE
jgi:glutaredoxin 3